MKYSYAILALLAISALSSVAYAADDEEKGEGKEKGGEKGEPKPPPKPPTKPVKGGGKGDPIMTGLDGRSFEFYGTAGKTYQVISEKNHQLSMTLAPGHMWDHEGTYVKAIGFSHASHTVEVGFEADTMTVSVDGKALSMLPSQTEQELLLGLAEGELSILWQLHRPELGQTVQIDTDILQVVVYLTPAGTRDEGGVEQPAYLNFDVQLLATPAGNNMEGIIGRTYATAFSGSAVDLDDFSFHGVEADFELASLFDTSHPTCLFGKASAGKARKLSEGETITFPLSAVSRGFAPALRAAARSLGRKALH